MVRLTRNALMVVIIFILWEQRAIGHDGWIEVSPALVEKGQAATIALMQGNHSNQHKSYRLAGKWDPKQTKLWVIDPKGREHDLSDRLIDLGEDPEKTGPKGPKGFHLAPFVANESGIYLVVARQERILQHGDGPKFRSVRTAASAFAAFPTPTVRGAKKLKWSNGYKMRDDALSILPLINLLGITEGEPVVLEVRHKGKPARDKVATVITRLAGGSSARDLQSNPEGIVNFPAEAADYHLVRVKFDERSERKEGEYELSSYEATYVFQAFHRP